MGGETKLDFQRALLVGVGYGLLAFGALSVTRFGATVESIWICNALLVWALTTARMGQWPLLVAASAIAHVVAHLVAGDALPLTFAALVGDMSECLLAAYLLRRHQAALSFATRACTFYFLLVCGLAAPLASSIIVWAATWAVGAPLGLREVSVWFSVDALALVLFLPIISAIAQGRWRDLKGKFWRLAAAERGVVERLLMAFAADPFYERRSRD
ncbi:MAG: MASE1 domain-containing protein [Terricaulis sp.]